MTTKPSYTPALRFPDFLNDGEWKVKRLGEIAEKVTSKNKSNKQLPVLTNSATEGVVNQQDYFDREIVTKDNLTNYHIIELNDFVYNPRISVAAPVGPISRNKIGTGIMSPLYTIFKFKEGNIDFFEQYFRTNCWHQYLKDKANFGARFDRMNISNEDFFNLPIPFPPLPEQRRIAQALTALDELIAATNEKLEQMKAYKKGLMQQLFVNATGGGKRLIINCLQIPKLRFPEFYEEKEWEEKKLGEIVNVYQGFGFPEKLQGKKKGKYPFIKVSDISVVTNKGDRFIEEAANYVDEEDLELLKAIPFPACTVVFAKIGEAIRLNRRVILKQKSLIDNNVGGVKAKSDLSNDSFVFYIMSMIDLKKYAGGVVPSVKKTAIENIDCVIPTLPEQRKIASCLSAMDETINAYTEKVGLLGQYKKGLMQRMFPQNQMN